VHRRLAATRSARLAGRVGPRATLSGLLLNTDWQTWLFLFDDAYCDESDVGRRPADTIEMATRVLRVVEKGEVRRTGRTPSWPRSATCARGCCGRPPRSSTTGSPRRPSSTCSR